MTIRVRPPPVGLRPPQTGDDAIDQEGRQRVAVPGDDDAPIGVADDVASGPRRRGARCPTSGAAAAAPACPRSGSGAPSRSNSSRPRSSLKRRRSPARQRLDRRAQRPDRQAGPAADVGGASPARTLRGSDGRGARARVRETGQPSAPSQAGACDEARPPAERPRRRPTAHGRTAHAPAEPPAATSSGREPVRQRARWSRSSARRAGLGRERLGRALGQGREPSRRLGRLAAVLAADAIEHRRRPPARRWQVVGGADRVERRAHERALDDRRSAIAAIEVGRVEAGEPRPEGDVRRRRLLRLQPADALDRRRHRLEPARARAGAGGPASPGPSAAAGRTRSGSAGVGRVRATLRARPPGTSSMSSV